MRITKKTDYCLRVLIYLQMHPGQVKIQTIADYYNVSKNHLSVAVNKLSELGYVLSMPGPQGGVSFNSKMAKTSVAHLIQKVEEMDLAECFNTGHNSCRIRPQCKLRGMLMKATHGFLQELDHYKIQDLI